jgi:hypothetical protein
LRPRHQSCADRLTRRRPSVIYSYQKMSRRNGGNLPLLHNFSAFKPACSDVLFRRRIVTLRPATLRSQ